MNPTTSISLAMHSPDQLVIEMRYTDRNGAATRRTVSPIRWIGGDVFQALCLCREEPRQFVLDRCRAVTLRAASDVLMPVEIG